MSLSLSIFTHCRWRNDPIFRLFSHPPAGTNGRPSFLCFLLFSPHIYDYFFFPLDLSIFSTLDLIHSLGALFTACPFFSTLFSFSLFSMNPVYFPPLSLYHLTFTLHCLCFSFQMNKNVVVFLILQWNRTFSLRIWTFTEACVCVYVP